MDTRNMLLIVSCCWLMLFCSACTSKVDNIKTNQEQGHKIIQAINRYEEEHGQFPEQLEILVPAYLSEIPKTVTGEDFVYELDDLRGYYLVFWVRDISDIVGNRGTSCAYTDRFEIWDCSPGSPEEY